MLRETQSRLDNFEEQTPPRQAGPQHPSSSTVSSSAAADAIWRHRTGSRPAAFHACFWPVDSWPAHSPGCPENGLCSAKEPSPLPAQGDPQCLVGGSAHFGVLGGSGSCVLGCAEFSDMRCRSCSRMRGQSLHAVRYSQAAPAAWSVGAAAALLGGLAALTSLVSAH